MSGGAAVAPTSMSAQTSWNWAFTGTTYEGMYTESTDNTFVYGSDNSYQTGTTYNSSYNYYNVGIVKMNSSQVVQWNTTKMQTADTAYGLNTTSYIWKTDSGYVGWMCPIYGYRFGSNKLRLQMHVLNDSTGATVGSLLGYNGNDASSTQTFSFGACQVSNVVGDKVAISVGDYVAGTGTDTSVNIFEQTSSAITPLWTVGNSELHNASTGGTDFTATALHLVAGTHGTVYGVGYFGATNVDGSGTNTNVGIFKYSSSGATATLDWTYVFRQQTGGVEHSMYSGGIALDGTDLYISGYSTAIGGSVNAPFVAKIDVSGTPSLTWITQASSASYNCYAKNIKLIGSDQVITLGYGQTDDPTGNAVVGVMVSLNQDGSTLGTADVDDITWTIIDLSSYIVFASGTAGGTANVSLTNVTGSAATWDVTSTTSTGTVNAWIHDIPADASGPVIVESGGVE
jgi:hypothetical protein